MFWPKIVSDGGIFFLYLAWITTARERFDRHNTHVQRKGEY